LKWGEPTIPDDNFDLIVGSDIIYSPVVLKSLAQTIHHYLKAGTGLALISNNRVRYDNYAHTFEKELAEAGLTIVDRIEIKEERATMTLLLIKK
jgi:hypothetical protein